MKKSSQAKKSSWLQLRIDPERMQRLDEEAQERGAPRAELVRRAIDAFMREQDKKRGVKETSKGADHGKQRDNARQSAE